MTADKTYYMHYIGSGLYGMKRFINESKRVGVQRVMPFSLMHKMDWDQPILCAEYKKVKDKELVAKYDETKLTATKEITSATIFGYFKVSSLSYADLPEDVKLRLVAKLNVVDMIQYDQPEQEQRSCGEYSVGGCCYVKNTIPEIVRAIQDVCEETGNKPNDFRYFIKGELKTLDKPIILYGKKFSRGYSKVTVPELDLDTDKPQKAMYFLYDYEKRTYLKKDDKDKLDKLLTEEFIEGVH